MKKQKSKPNPPQQYTFFVFEASWEVCNKVGGIYTVLTSKAKQFVDHYKERYFLIGPYFKNKIRGEFQACAPPAALKRVFTELKDEGIDCHFGAWLVKGEPRVILLDFQNCWTKINELKGGFWQWYGIDSLGAGDDFNEPLAWAYAVGRLLEKIEKTFKNEKIVAHFHEWLAGGAILCLKQKKSGIKTVFTTHATTLGRTLAYNNVNFYEALSAIAPDEEALRYNISAKHLLEKQAAKQCDIFTTVSEITKLEAERFLERRVDAVLPNGLDAQRFLTFEDITIKHQIQRNRLREFILFYFFPYYAFDIEHTLFYFLTARYEFRAKGIDVLIRALQTLNQKLAASETKRTIVVFFFVPTSTGGIRPELLENRELFQDIKKSFEEVSPKTHEKILYALTQDKAINEASLFETDFLFEIKKKILRLKREGSPPLSTHLIDEKNDPIMQEFYKNGLLNKESDKVKVVFYPAYLTGHDGLSNLSYEEGIQACHLGIFPSFYEPWGYTPLETMSAGVSAITTDLAGFGRFCQTIKRDQKYPGIIVLNRFNKSDSAATDDLADAMMRFALYSHQERVENKIQARELATRADWKALMKNYIQAHIKAFHSV